MAILMPHPNYQLNITLQDVNKYIGAMCTRLSVRANKIYRNWKHDIFRRFSVADPRSGLRGGRRWVLTPSPKMFLLYTATLFFFIKHCQKNSMPIQPYIAKTSHIRLQHI